MKEVTRCVGKVFFGGFLLIALLKFGLQLNPVSVAQYLGVLEEKLPEGVTVHFSKPVLTWDFWLRPLEVVIKDVRLCGVQGKGKPCVHASRVGVTFSLWSLK